jgi:hypothetical protein
MGVGICGPLRMGPILRVAAATGTTGEGGGGSLVGIRVLRAGAEGVFVKED